MKNRVNKVILKAIENEILMSDGSGKLLLAVAFINVAAIFSLMAFIPFLSQILTGMCLAFLYKKLLRNRGEKITAIKNKKVSFKIKKSGYYLIIITFFAQFPFAWVPYITQVVTCLLLLAIYATMTKYEKEK
mgnify:CR=1 FL=1